MGSRLVDVSSWMIGISCLMGSRIGADPHNFLAITPLINATINWQPFRISTQIYHFLRVKYIFPSRTTILFTLTLLNYKSLQLNPSNYYFVLNSLLS